MNSVDFTTSLPPPTIMVDAALPQGRPRPPKLPLFNAAFKFLATGLHERKSARIAQPPKQPTTTKGKGVAHAPCQIDVADVCASCAEALDQQDPQGSEILEGYLPLLPYGLSGLPQGEDPYPRDELDKGEDADCECDSDDASLRSDDTTDSNADLDEPLTPSELRIMLEPLDRRPSGVAVPESYTPSLDAGQEGCGLQPVLSRPFALPVPPTQARDGLPAPSAAAPSLIREGAP